MKRDLSLISKFLSLPGNNRVIFIIDIIDDVKEALALPEFLIKEKADIVFLRSGLPFYFEGLKERGLNIKLEADYLDMQDYEDIDNFTYKLTRNWYKGLTQYKGIELGSIIEYDFQLYLIKRLKLLKVIDSVIKRDNPSGLVIISADAQEFNGIIEIIKETYDIEVIPFIWKKEKIFTFSDRKGLRSVIAELLVLIMDSFSRILWHFWPSLDNKVLLDTRVYSNLLPHVRLPDNFMPIPFEKGLRLRISLLRKAVSYLPFYFPSHFSFANVRAFLKKSDLLAEKLPSNIYTYEGKSIWGIIAPKFKEYFLETFPRLAKNIDLFESILKRKMIKGIVLNHDLWELQRLCVELSKKHNIPSLIVQHGVFGEKGEEIIFADKIAVWGKMCVDIYKDFGNDSRKCVVTGNPKHDKLYFNPLPLESRDRICRKLNIDTQKPIVLLLSESAQNHILSSFINKDRGAMTIAYLVKAMLSLPDKQLVVKLHPFEDKATALGIIKHFKAKNVTVVKDIDLYSLINASDIVITRESSATLKAMILKKPIITLNFEKRPDIVPFAPYGASLGVYKPQDILSTIEKVFSDNSLIERLQTRSQCFINDYAYKIDGQSSKRVLNFILEETRC